MDRMVSTNKNHIKDKEQDLMMDLLKFISNSSEVMILMLWLLL